MKEEFIHYLWKYSKFIKLPLKTQKNKVINIIAVGIHNKNAGPDFINAKIEIDEIIWAGNIEIHLKSSEWYAHRHHEDKAYESVILHIVWQHDVEIFLPSGNILPTLEIAPHVDKKIIDKYHNFFTKKINWIPCENNFTEVPKIHFKNWLERIFFERLERKTQKVYQLLDESKNDWEAVLFYLLAHNFGLKINADAFFAIAKTISFNTVRKIAFDPIDLEALFLGQANLLENENIDENYFLELKKRYEYLKMKFQIQKKPQKKITFFRLRPPNFPTIRLSQLAQLYAKHQNLFSKIINIPSLNQLEQIFKVNTAPFWQNHYTFEKQSPKKTKSNSLKFIHLIVINTLIPLRFAYEKKLDILNEETLLELIKQLPPEINTITHNFQKLGTPIPSAFYSQSLLELKNEYCNPKKCLQCSVGFYLMNNP